MARALTMSAGRSRLMLGPDVRLVEASAGQLWLEGRVRLRPGQSVDLIGPWPGLPTPPTRAHVVTWRVVRLGREGPYYRGCCRVDA